MASSEFGKELKHHMYMRQVSAADISKALRLSTSYFYGVRSGYVIPTVRVVNRIMDFLEMSDKDRARMYYLLARCKKSLKLPMDLMSAKEKAVVAKIYCKYVHRLGG